MTATLIHLDFLYRSTWRTVSLADETQLAMKLVYTIPVRSVGNVVLEVTVAFLEGLKVLQQCEELLFDITKLQLDL